MKQETGRLLHEELAKTYFRAEERKHENKKAGRRFGALPWVITAVVIAAASVIVLSRSSIDIKVRFLGEVPSFSVLPGAGGAERGDLLIKGGKPEKDTVKNAYFAGDGRNYSVEGVDQLALCNARGSGWANFTVELKEPADLTKLDLKYSAKGSRGGENLVLVIVDGSNKIYRMEKDLSSSLSSGWQQYRVNFRPIKKALDLTNVKTIKFEFGSLTADNYSGAVIYLKDIYLTKTRRLKWL